MESRTCWLLNCSVLAIRTRVWQVTWGVVCNTLLRDKFSVLWPFHKDPWQRTLFHFVVGTVFCQVVVFQVSLRQHGSMHRVVLHMTFRTLASLI